MINSIIRNRGFTIIEVMLFLAVSGALAAGILASSSIAINSQRYRDATNSLQSTLQQQYNQTSHAINDRRGPSERCNASGVTTGLTSGGEPRGASDCLLMGRYVSLDENGEMTLSNVIGYKARSATATTETQELRNYDYFIDPSSTESTEVAWGGTLTFRSANNQILETGNDRELGMMVLRSPLTGVTRTFIYSTSKNVQKINSSVVTESNSQSAHKICVNPSLFNVGTKLGILIRERAAGAGAIELLTEDSAC